MIIEKPKRDDWKTLLIMLPTLLVFVGVMILMPPTCSKQCEQISTTPVATVPLVEEGDDVSTLKIGNNLGSTRDDGMGFVFGNLVPVVSGVIADAWTMDPNAGVPEPWPANMVTDSSAYPIGKLALYVTVDSETLVADAMYANVVVPAAASVHAAIYTEALELVAAATPQNAGPSSYDWIECPFAAPPMLVDGHSYWFMVYVNGDMAGAVRGEATGFPDAVLPLLKTNSGSEAGLLR